MHGNLAHFALRCITFKFYYQLRHLFTPEQQQTNSSKWNVTARACTVAMRTHLVHFRITFEENTFCCIQYPGSMSLSSLICWTASSAAGRASAVRSTSLLASSPSGRTTLPSLPHSVEAGVVRELRKMARQNNTILQCGVWTTVLIHKGIDRITFKAS